MKYISHLHHMNPKLSPLVKEVIGVVKLAEVEISRGCSDELRRVILNELMDKGWSGKVQIAPAIGITITSMRDNTALCLQTGNMARFYADLLKIQYLYQNNKAEESIYILPTKRCAIVMGDNLANFERFTSELDVFKDIISTPIVVIGIDRED